MNRNCVDGDSRLVGFSFSFCCCCCCCLATYLIMRRNNCIQLDVVPCTFSLATFPFRAVITGNARFTCMKNAFLLLLLLLSVLHLFLLIETTATQSFISSYIYIYVYHTRNTHPPCLLLRKTNSFDLYKCCTYRLM